MRSLLCLFLVFTSFSVIAKEYQFRVYESSVEEFEPFEVIIEQNDLTKTVSSLIVKEIKSNIVFFDLNESQLESVFDNNTLNVKDIVENLNALNEEVYNNYWGDAPIGKEYTYAIYLSLELNDSLDIIGGNIDIAHNEYEEMALWGDLILK